MILFVSCNHALKLSAFLTFFSAPSCLLIVGRIAFSPFSMYPSQDRFCLKLLPSILQILVSVMCLSSSLLFFITWTVSSGGIPASLILFTHARWRSSVGQQMDIFSFSFFQPLNLSVATNYWNRKRCGGGMSPWQCMPSCLFSHEFRKWSFSFSYFQSIRI